MKDSEIMIMIMINHHCHDSSCCSRHARPCSMSPSHRPKNVTRGAWFGLGHARKGHATRMACRTERARRCSPRKKQNPSMPCMGMVHYHSGHPPQRSMFRWSIHAAILLEAQKSGRQVSNPRLRRPRLTSVCCRRLLWCVHFGRVGVPRRPQTNK